MSGAISSSVRRNGVAYLWTDILIDRYRSTYMTSGEKNTRGQAVARPWRLPLPMTELSLSMLHVTSLFRSLPKVPSSF